LHARDLAWNARSNTESEHRSGHNPPLRSAPCDAVALLDGASLAALIRMLHALLRARKWWSVICGSGTLGLNSGSQNLVRYLGVQQTCAGTSRLAAIDFSHDQDPMETLACVSCLSLARQARCPAASKINRVISSEREISERWLAFTSIVFAPISLGHEALEVRIDRTVFRGNGVVAGLRSPCGVSSLSGEQCLVERLLDGVEHLRFCFW
jgi:hypothetical protein